MQEKVNVGTVRLGPATENRLLAAGGADTGAGSGAQVELAGELDHVFEAGFGRAPLGEQILVDASRADRGDRR